MKGSFAFIALAKSIYYLNKKTLTQNRVYLFCANYRIYSIKRPGPLMNF